MKNPRERVCNDSGEGLTHTSKALAWQLHRPQRFKKIHERQFPPQHYSSRRQNDAGLRAPEKEGMARN